MRQEHKDIFGYAADHSSREKTTLAELERKTHLRTLAPQMSTGRLQGRLLSILSKLVSPTRVLEIGTFAGYGALCLAEGLTSDGVVHTIESNAEVLVLARSAFEESKYGEQIKIHHGDALEILKDWDEAWDLVYLDGAKKQYLDYYDLVIDRLRPGGLLLADNVLWNGRVFEGKQTEESTILDLFNKRVRDDQRVENVLLPLRDGLMVCRKI